jgi:hypothetical protein
LLIGYILWLKNKKSRPQVKEVQKTAPDPVKLAMQHFFNK